MVRNLPVVVMALIIFIMLGWIIWVTTPTPSCAKITVGWPAEEVWKEYFVRDEDGYRHEIKVLVRRPAHQHEVCQ